MSTHSVETKQAIELQHASSDAYRLARDVRDADTARIRSPSVVAMQQAAAHAYVDAARARVAATGI
ncbi:hypothetical protein HT746_15955 [Burkholderia pyrrocinia]|uniref:hypothetical protein n=1 Tax=Burkholderia pyrrocinia TaxID=60550 RepID=UPI0015754F2A|nr:hypothetical protein [Burkholderia pyrrocinia]NTX28605.1 hypothetical protein [Burkholderia pyrrocinia]QVN23526.1 hypothetical protein JYG32_34200 [Burkholderia pyrrocinia]